MSLTTEEMYLQYLTTREPISADGATSLYEEYYYEIGSDKKLSMLSYLFSVVERECARGIRCAVCFRVNDSRCTEEC